MSDVTSASHRRGVYSSPCKQITYSGVTVMAHLAHVLELVKTHRLLLQADAHLPNVCTLVTGEPVRGSWWGRHRSHEIFRVNCNLADHPDVLLLKLISEKNTYVHRALWPAIVAVGQARESWQMGGLSRDALVLLEKLERGSPLETSGGSSKAASELEKLLLIHSEQFHTESGSHARSLESWDAWRRRRNFKHVLPRVPQAKRQLEGVLEVLNAEFGGRGRLPWQRRTESGRTSHRL